MARHSEQNYELLCDRNRDLVDTASSLEEVNRHDVTSECRAVWASYRPDLVEAFTSGNSVVDLICSIVNIEDTSPR
jgi:hypothetical protein